MPLPSGVSVTIPPSTPERWVWFVTQTKLMQAVAALLVDVEQGTNPEVECFPDLYNVELMLETQLNHVRSIQTAKGCPE